MARVVVVGGGFAGVSVAVRLAKLRHEVVLLESGTRVGGRLRGFRPAGEVPGADAWQLSVDTFTLPGVLRDLFRKSGRILDTALTLETVAGRRHVFADHLLPHGTARSSAPEDPGTTHPALLDLPMGRRSDQTEAVSAAFGADEWTPVLDRCPDAWDVVRRRLLNRLPDGPDDLDRDARRTLAARRSLARLARKDVDDERIRAMLLDPVRLAGDDPRLVPAALALVHYLDRNFGRWHVAGGLDRLADALADRLTQRRVDVRLETSGIDIDLSQGAVRGVRTPDGTIDADVAVWAAPSWPAAVPEPRLLPRIPASRCLVRLTEDPGLPHDVAVHASPPLHLWSEDGLHWTVAHHNAEDPLIALVRVGIDVRPLVGERHDLSPSDLVRLGHWGWQWQGWKSSFARPSHARSLPAGLFVAGAHAHSGASLEQIGMATEAIAEHLGAVPRS